VSFVYVLACRLFELVVLPVRRDSSKELEISRLGSAAGDPATADAAAAVHAIRPFPADGAQPRAAASLVACVVGDAGDVAALASTACRPSLDLPASSARPFADRGGRARAHPAARA
jgi:hypothetical protein